MQSRAVENSIFLHRANSKQRGVQLTIDDTWIPTLITVVNDAAKFNEGLRHSQTVKDVEDIEEWMLQIVQFKEQLEETVRGDEGLFAKYGSLLEGL